MIKLEEGKEWLRIDEESDQDDKLVTSLIELSKADIKASTGVPSDYKDKVKEESLNVIDELYNMCQRILISDLFYEKAEENKALNSYYIKLELKYRRALKNEA